MNFYDRYKYLCGLKHLSPQSKEIMNALGVSSGTITGWSRGVTPKPEMLAVIARYFDVSVDYLLGLSDIPRFEHTIGEMTELIVECANVRVHDNGNGSGLEYIITYEGKTFNYQENEWYALCNKLKTRINDSKLQLVEDFCQEIFGDETHREISSISKEEQDLIDRFRKLNAEGKTMVNAAIIQELRRLE